MIYNLSMFSQNKNIAISDSVGYGSVIKHSHTFVEMVYVEEGLAVHQVLGQNIEIKKGDLFIINTGIEHSIKPISQEDKFKIKNIILDPSLFSNKYEFSPLEVFNEYNNQIDEIVRMLEKAYEFMGHNEDDMVLLIDMILNLCEYERREKNKRVSDISKKKQDEYVEKATMYIRENYANKIALNDIADYVGVYPTYLEKLFKEYRNTTIQKHLLSFRMEKSCQYLLEGNLPIEEICRLVGINDKKNYYLYFKKFFNTTPKKFREEKFKNYNN